MKIAFFEYEGWEESIIKENFPNDEVVFVTGALNDKALPPQADYDAISIFVGSHITANGACGVSESEIHHDPFHWF